ncbi:MAG: GntR family transcriptional regulator, partial [Bacteroidaceae bacterium]|nr:GntR family transcriptional regulator [Bacteroidaceae bacterium]
MKINFGHQTTKVKQLADKIGLDISMGVLKPGALLPSINKLSTSYEVSRDTVFKAFLDLKERGMIDSTPGKGYYVVSKLKNVLLLLDEFSPFKEELYTSFANRLSLHYKVDLLFHQYSERLFNTIIRESVGRYNKYIVMNFDNEKFSLQLNKISPSKLLLLDFGKFDKGDFSYVCQDFDAGFYHALQSLSERMMKYQKIVFLLAKDSKHPHSSCDYFKKFCADLEICGEVADNIDNLKICKGEAYIVIRQSDVVNIIKRSRLQGLKCGIDFGLLAYNDIPAYEVIDQGITALSIDWEKMGARAAAFVIDGKPMQIYLPTEVRLRASL